VAALLEVEHLRIEIPSRGSRPVAVDDVSLAIERGEVLGVIAETADRVAVMYAGRIVEIGPVRDVVKAAKQPYTRGLMGSIPLIGGKAARLRQIDGSMPRLDSIPGGAPSIRAAPRRSTAAAGSGPIS